MNQFIEIEPTALNQNTFQLIGQNWMLITAGNQTKANTMTASWGGLGIMFNKNVAYIVVRPQRYTREFIDMEDTFSLSFLDNKYKKVLGYLGSVSGKAEDKIAKSGLNLDYDEGTPYFKEAETVFFCRKLIRQPLNQDSLLQDNLDSSFYPEKDYHILYIAEITKVFQSAK